MVADFVDPPLMSEMAQETIENLRARSNALRKGDALLTIKGEGLSPQIEAFMLEILKRVQVIESDA